MSNELLEEYIKAIESPGYKRNWIEAFIYLYKNPESIPLDEWLEKLNNDVDYFEKQWKTKLMSKYDEIRNEIIETHCSGIDSIKLSKWRLIVNLIISKHPGSWLSIYASEIINVSDSNIEIGILGMSEDKLKHIQQLLEVVKKDISIHIGHYFRVDFKGIKSNEYIFHIPYNWDELKNDPQVFFDILDIRDLNLAESLIRSISNNIVKLKDDVERFERLRIESKKTLNKLDVSDTRKWNNGFKPLDLILKNDLDLANYQSFVGGGSTSCNWESIKFFSGKKYKSCSIKATNWDIFCEEHSSKNNVDKADKIRQYLIFETSKKQPRLNQKSLNILFAHPTEEVVLLRKHINRVSEELLLKQWERSISDDEEYIYRFNLQVEVLNRLKPIYEKYRFIKFGRPPIPMTTKLQILKKSNFKCVLCNADLMEKEPHIDHIIPLYKGGGSETSNLQALCWECNLKKGVKIL